MASDFRWHARAVVHYQDDNVRRIIGSPDGMVGQRLQRLADQIATSARRRAPRASGRLAGSIRSHVGGRGGSLQGVVEATARHAKWVHDGTGIYGPRHTMIRPKSGPYMSWKQHGTWIVAKAVKGIPPRPFMEAAAQAVIARRSI